MARCPGYYCNLGSVCVEFDLSERKRAPVSMFKSLLKSTTREGVGRSRDVCSASPLSPLPAPSCLSSRVFIYGVSPRVLPVEREASTGRPIAGPPARLPARPPVLRPFARPRVGLITQISRTIGPENRRGIQSIDCCFMVKPLSAAALTALSQRQRPQPISAFSRRASHRKPRVYAGRSL